jgi:hypothetical protein
MNVQNISFLCTHFGSFEWIDLWASQVRQTVPSGLVAEMVVINQDRTPASRDELIRRIPGVKVLEYPRDEVMFKHMGHDHATVLNQAMHDVCGEWVCIMDSDAHATSLSWLDRVENLLNSHDAVLAEDSGNLGLSHPCFMFIRGDHAKRGLRFDAGIPGPGSDTGRLIGKQLVEQGRKVYLAPGRGVFGGLWGALYLESIYHHGHGSFNSAGPRLQCQLTWRDKFYRDRVLSGRRYELSLAELLLVRADWLARGLRTVAARQLRGLPQFVASRRKIA